MSIYLRNFLRFCLLVIIQVALLNKIPLRWWAEPFGFPVFVPMIYPLIILLLPFNTPKWLLYVLAFSCGLVIDMYNNTPGMHALATLCMAGLRPMALDLLLPKNIEEYGGQTPGTKNMTWIPFITYAAAMVVVHHLVYFVLELWSLRNFFYLLIKTLASTITTLLFVLAYVLLFTKQSGFKRVKKR